MDPFMGSGTTNVEALARGRPSVGLEVNPFARLLARVKTTPLETDDLIALARPLLRAVARYHPSVNQPVIPTVTDLSHWFPPHSAHELAHIVNCIWHYVPAGEYQNFFIITLTSLVRAASRVKNGSPPHLRSKAGEKDH